MRRISPMRRLVVLMAGIATVLVAASSSAGATVVGSAKTTGTTVPPAPTTTVPGPVTTIAGKTTTTTAPPAPVLSGLRPVGAAILSDADAAAKVRRSAWEPRPANSVANHTVPTAAQLSTFNSYTGQWGTCDNLRRKVTGNFTGTTDEIIQWAAWKWGLPEDVLRAVAVTESNWNMSAVGDSGASFGLTQIKNMSQWHGGTYPLSATATAFNADYHAGMLRHYFEGCATWMRDYSYNGTTYAAGDLWGAVGAWYSGDWHSNAANTYIASVKDHQARRTWAQPGF
jgi:hypothetical protein